MASAEPPTPRVSIVMSVRNGARFLPEAIESMLRQTMPDFEFIIVDDGSTDDSYTIASRYQQSDPRVRVMRTPEPGLANAVNAGLAASHAPWIARMDADDVSLPERLERQLAFLDANPDVAAVGAYGLLMGETGRIVGQSRMGPATREEFRRLYKTGELVYLLQPATMFSREIGMALGGYRQNCVPAEDVEFFSRIADEHVALAIPEPLLLQRIQRHSTSTRRFREQMEAVRRARVNMVRRRAGKEELTTEQFLELERSDPALVRWRRGIRWRSQLCYRRGGRLLAARQPQGILWLAASALLYPPLPFQRLRMQRVASTIMMRSRDKPTTESQ